MSAPKYRPDIDGLRAVAVLSVLVFHVDSSVLPGGFAGVDIFFVISGYLISLILFREQDDGSFSFANFYSRRIRRLFPALGIVLATTLAFGSVALFADEYKQLSKHAVSAIVFLLNLRLMDEAGYFDVASSAKPLLHLWSLSVEEQFYLLWPVMLVVAARLRIPRNLILLVCAIVSFAFAIWLGHKNPDTLYYHPLARFWELLIGAALATWHHVHGVGAIPDRLKRPTFQHVLSLLGIGLLTWGVFGIDSAAAYPSSKTLLPVVGAAVLIESGEQALVNRLLAAKPLVFVGVISYPLYLWHWPVLSYLNIMESGAASIWLLWAGAGLSFVLACYTYLLLERPLRQSARPRRTVSVLVGAMAGLLVVSRAVAAADGLPHRSAVLYMIEQEQRMRRQPRQDESCLALFDRKEAPVYCLQHNPGPRMLGIIGDSHAHALFPGVAEMAAEKGYGTLLLANSSCPPLDGAVTGRNAVEHGKCARNVETILHAIETDARVSAVLIVTRGPIYLTGKGYGPAEAKVSLNPLAAREGASTTSHLSPQAIFAAGLMRSSERIRQSGKGVGYFLQVPELGVPARNCLRRPVSLSAKEGCAVRFEDYRNRMDAYRSLVRNLHSSHDFLKIIDPEQLFCDSSECAGLMEGQLLYADDDHLSPQGSRHVAPAVVDFLAPKGIDK